MKTKTMLKPFVCILVVILMLQASPHAFAHSSSQEGILAKSCHSKYGGYYIGGESVGWSIDESYHTNGTTLTYSFLTSDSYLNSTYKSYVTTGASRWSGTITITNKTDGSGVGEISTFNDPDTNTTAKFCEYSSNSSGHLTSWKIKMNRAKTVTATTLAHEFGHAIGLNDLYESRNKNKLMYGISDRTVTSPTSSDKWGAKVITGVHSSHTWGYKYYSTNSIGNTHVKYCTSCNGLSLVTEQCTYNSNNVCTKCGIPYGVQPYSFGDSVLQGFPQPQCKLIEINITARRAGGMH